MTLIEKLIKKYERTVRDMIETTEVIDILKKLKGECDDTTKRIR